MFGGDTLLTRRVNPSANPFAQIRPALATADLAILNLETALTTRGLPQTKSFVFRSTPSFARRMADAGIDVVSVANNHTLDYGTVGLTDTLRNLAEAQVRATGAGENLQEALRPAFVRIGDTSPSVCVAVLGASQIIPSGAWIARATRPGIAAAGAHRINADTGRVLAAVRAAAEVSDVVVVVMHWGIEGAPCPEPVQRKLGVLLRDAGATVVLGAHPHILQPIVTDTARSGKRVNTKGLIAYSLGNFIWDPRSGATGDTGVLEVRFSGTAFSGHTFYPHRLNANGWASTVNAASTTGKRIISRTTNRCGG
jgi:poly-gamma-glutamate capsule biosynthesis protein CapA/YwtB (metallophosphatase superfamily)